MNGHNPSKARLRKSQAVLEIPNVQLEDAGMYECKAENSRGRNVFRGQLQVYSKCNCTRHYPAMLYPRILLCMKDAKVQ